MGDSTICIISWFCPNDVHILFTPQEAVSRIMRSLKRHSAGKVTAFLTGVLFWQDESYDRLVRDEREFERIAAYIEKGSGGGSIGERSGGVSLVESLEAG